ncbi:MAG: hypothetical protein HGA76_09865, partial [Candidatus Firestonebacteria bacterium]|nr:hypothetical protein [Candidatus Firestonebacteria bacterium]
MFTNNDLMLSAVLTNIVSQKIKVAHLVVEELVRDDHAQELPERRTGFMATAWRSVSPAVWIGKIIGKSKRLFSSRQRSGKEGTVSFEASKHQALDRANSWSVSKTSRTKARGGYLGLEHRQRVRPIDPCVPGELLSDSEK